MRGVRGDREGGDDCLLRGVDLCNPPLAAVVLLFMIAAGRAQHKFRVLDKCNNMSSI